MKAEKCPQCDARPLSYTIHSIDGSRVSVWERVCPKCGHGEVSITWRGAIRKFNRWARSERRRIEREKK